MSATNIQPLAMSESLLADLFQVAQKNPNTIVGLDPSGKPQTLIQLDEETMKQASGSPQNIARLITGHRQNDLIALHDRHGKIAVACIKTMNTDLTKKFRDEFEAFNPGKTARTNLMYLQEENIRLIQLLTRSI